MNRLFYPIKIIGCIKIYIFKILDLAENNFVNKNSKLSWR
jgi:hypothetical protein